MTEFTRIGQHGIPRGARADAEDTTTIWLLKNVSKLTLTYQIQLLAFRARTSGRTLEIRVPARCFVEPRLETFAREQKVRIVRV